MPRIDTGIQDILSGPSGTALFSPMTGALNANEWRRVRFRVWGAAPSPSALEVCPGVQFSDDGVNWSTYAPVAFSYTSYATLPDGWTWTDFAELKSVFASTPRLYLRFGLFVEAETASDPGSTQARMVIEGDAVSGWTVSAGPKLVGSKEMTEPSVFWPLTEWLPSTDAVKARATQEIVTTSPPAVPIFVQSAVQVADDLTDPSSWGAAAPKGLSYSSSVGVTYPVYYTDIGETASTPPAEAYVRFGVLVRHEGSGTDGKPSAVVSLRVDVRDRE